jgi:hypothetical protein
MEEIPGGQARRYETNAAAWQPPDGKSPAETELSPPKGWKYTLQGVTNAAQWVMCAPGMGKNPINQQ